MILSLNSGTPQIFPYQRKTDAQKTEKWGRECVDAGVDLVNYENNSNLLKTKREMATLYNLVNGIIDQGDKKVITNPLNLKGFKFPGTAQTYPLTTPLLSVLTGEERNRQNNYDVNVINSDAVSQKQEDLKKRLDIEIVSGIQNTSESEQEVKERLEKFGKWAKYSYRDARERMGRQVLDYLHYSQDLDFEFSRGFEDLLIVGHEIYVTDIVAGEPIIRKGNPLNFTFVRSSDSPYPEDSDIIIEDGFLPLGKIVDEYHDVLTETELKRLEQGETMNKKISNSMFKFQNSSNSFDFSELVENSGGVESLLGTPTNSAVFGLNGSYDKYGRVRRTRVLWKSMRKVGFLQYVDEFGDVQKVMVPEQYEPDKEKGEIVEWQWISEWWEGTRLGEDIYVKVQPREVQFREMTNKSKCHPGVVGIINNVNNSKVTSFISALKPIQYLYDEFVYRLETAFMTSYGNIARMDLSQIPDGWDTDKWLYYATVFKWAVQDPFKEGTEGAAAGAIAGNMNVHPNTFNLDQGNLIQQNVNMLAYLENRANDIAGITPQRMGATSSRETVGGIERAVVQSSHRTEKWFSLHDQVKMRVYKMALETAKCAWKKDKFKRSFFMDSMTQKILDFDGRQFNEAEYGVIVNDSKVDSNIKNMIQGSRDVLFQNGFKLSSVIDILRSKDLASQTRKIEQQEAEFAKRQEESEKRALESQERVAQIEDQRERDRMALEERKNIMDNQTKLTLGLKEDAPEDDSLERSKFLADVEESQKKLRLDEDKLNETIRHNKATEKLSRTKSKPN